MKKKFTILIIAIAFLAGSWQLFAKGPPASPPATYTISQAVSAFLATVTENVQDAIDTIMTQAEWEAIIGADYKTEAKLKALMPVTQTISLANTDVLTPTAGYKWIDINATCTTNPTSTITVAETGAIETATMRFRNVGTYACAIVYAANNFEHKGGTGKTMIINAGDSFEAKYSVTLSKWTVTVNQTSTTWQSQTAVQDPQVGDPDSVPASFATGAHLYGGTMIATAAGTYVHSAVVVSEENFTMESKIAAEVAMTVNGSDTTWYNGVSCGAGKGIDSDASVDAFVACQYQAANTINCRGVSWNCTP